MWKWLLTIAQLAATINMRRSAIFFVLELLRQFDRSLTNSEIQLKPKQSGKSGFVYIIRDRADVERFKVGYRAKRPWRDSQLRSELGENGDFILIIPAKNASALEKRLRRAYAEHSKRSEWFSLNESERREILIIAALIKVAASDNLGMSAVDQEIVQTAEVLLKQLKELIKTVWYKRERERHQPDKEDGASEVEPGQDDFSTIPDIDWNWESVLDEHYRDLPEAKGKSSYICIIRDNDERRGKIFFDDHPDTSIDAALTERSLRFPLEVVLMLKVDKKKKAKEFLLSPSERKEGTEWIELSDEQLGDIRQSAKEEYIHGSLYVSVKTHWGLKSLSDDNYNDLPKLEDPAGYICVVQGVQPGNRYKIWRTDHPNDSGGIFGMPGQLNNPHDALHSAEPVKFRCVIQAEFAKPFETSLKGRYSDFRRRSDWFKLDDWFELEDRQLQEICNLGM